MKSQEFMGPEFIQIPWQIYSNNELSGTDKMVYGLIYWYRNLKLEKCIASNSTFSELLGVTERAVSESISKLSSKEFVQVIYKDSGKRNRLEIIPLVVFGKKPIEQMFHHDRTEVPTLDRTNVPHIYNNTIEDIHRDTRISKSPTYLLEIPEQDIENFRKKYKATKSEIIVKGEALHNWSGSVGKKYKDYRLFLMNALLRDYGLRELDNKGTAL